MGFTKQGVTGAPPDNIALWLQPRSLVATPLFGCDPALWLRPRSLVATPFLGYDPALWLRPRYSVATHLSHLCLPRSGLEAKIIRRVSHRSGFIALRVLMVQWGGLTKIDTGGMQTAFSGKGAGSEKCGWVWVFRN